MTRAAIVVAALLAPFFFPWPFALLLACALSLYVPFAGVAVGIIADALYYSTSVTHIPWATVAALIGALVAYGVRGFAKTRIIGA